MSRLCVFLQVSQSTGVSLELSQRLQQLQRNPQLVCCHAGELNLSTCPRRNENVHHRGFENCVTLRKLDPSFT